MRYTVVKENGNFITGEAYDEVVDAVQKDMTSCEVAGYTVHIVSVESVTVDEAVVTVKVEGIDG